MNEIIDAGAPAESVDGDVFEHADRPPAVKTPGGDIELDARGRLALYLAVGLAAGAVIALQIDIMRVFAVGNWTHFGSLVVSLAMLGFGLTSAVMAVGQELVRAQLARRGERRARSLWAAGGRRRTFISSSSASTRSTSSPIPTRSGNWPRFSSPR